MIFTNNTNCLGLFLPNGKMVKFKTKYKVSANKTYSISQFLLREKQSETDGIIPKEISL